MKKQFLLSLFLIFSFSFSFAQKLDATEQKLIKKIQENHAETMRLLTEVVNINSGTLNHEGVKAVGAVFKRGFEKIGFKTFKSR